MRYAESNWRAASGWDKTQPLEAADLFAQSAEKYLKALLVWQKKSVPDSTDLVFLLKNAIPQADGFTLESGTFLNLAIQRSRYPNESEAPDVEEIQAFRNAAAFIRQIVREALRLEDIP